jgi:hypothetical protein
MATNIKIKKNRQKFKKKMLIPPFFVSMATAAKFVRPIPIFFLAYLVPLDVDVVPNKLDQFLFSSYYYSSTFFLSFFLSFFRQKFTRYISRRLLNGNQ